MLGCMEMEAESTERGLSIFTVVMQKNVRPIKKGSAFV